MYYGPRPETTTNYLGKDLYMTIKYYLLLILCSINAALMCAQQPTSNPEQKFELLISNPQPQKIADALWDVIDSPELLKVLINHAEKILTKEQSHAVAQALLAHGANIYALLFKKCVKTKTTENALTDFYITQQPQFIGRFRTQLFCWDTNNLDSQPSFRDNRLHKVRINNNNKDAALNVIMAHNGNCITYVTTQGICKYFFDSRKKTTLPINPSEIVLLTENFAITTNTEKKDLFLYDLNNCQSCLILNQSEKEALWSVNKMDSDASPTEPAQIVIEGKDAEPVDISPDGRFIVWQDKANTILMSVQSKQFFLISPKNIVKFTDDCKYLIISGYASSHAIHPLNEPHTVKVWNLQADVPRQVFSHITDHAWKICDLIFLPNTYLFINNMADLEISVIDLITGSILLKTKYESYAISSDNRFIGWILNNELFIWSIKEKTIIKKIAIQIPTKILAISCQGSYLAMQDYNDTGSKRIYSTKTNTDIMRFKCTHRKVYFHPTIEHYLAGYHTIENDASSSQTSISYWNVATSRKLISWKNDITSTSKIHFDHSFPVFCVDYDTKNKRITTLDMNDIIQLDTSINSLNSLERATELAIIANKITLTGNAKTLLSSALEECKQTSEENLGTFTKLLLNDLDRLNAYDSYLDQQTIAHTQASDSSGETFQQPAAKRAKTVTSEINTYSSQDHLDIDQSSIALDSQSIKTLKEIAKQHNAEIIDCVQPLQLYNQFSKSCKFPICEYISLPPLISHYLLAMNDLMRLATPEGMLPQSGKLWHCIRLNLCLNMLPTIKTTIQQQWNAAFMLKFFHEFSEAECPKSVCSTLTNCIIDSITQDTFFHAITRMSLGKPEYYNKLSIMFQTIRNSGLKNIYGQTALDIAIQAGDQKLVQVIKQAIA